MRDVGKCYGKCIILSIFLFFRYCYIKYHSASDVSKAFKGSMEADIQKDTANLRNAANKKGRMIFIIETVCEEICLAAL